MPFISFFVKKTETLFKFKINFTRDNPLLKPYTQLMLKSKYKALILDIVKKYLDTQEYTLFMFGSRAKNSEKVFSDIDLGIWSAEELAKTQIRKIKEDLESSTLPFQVDFVDFKSTDDTFKKIALQKVDIWVSPQIFQKLQQK